MKRSHLPMAAQRYQARVVWVTSAPDTNFRVRDEDLDVGAAFKLRRCNLNKAAQTAPVVAACERAGIHNLAEVAVDSILGVALIEPSFVFDPLQSLTDSERMQKDFFQGLYHAANAGEDLNGALNGALTFFKVCSFVKLGREMPVQRVGSRQSRAFFSRMQEGQLDRLLDSLAADRIFQPQWLQEALKQNRAQAMIHLPLPFSVLVAVGEWRSFCACDMRGSLYKGWTLGACPLVWEDGQLPVLRMPELEVENIMHVETAAKFAQDLQAIYATMCELIGSDLGPDAARKMHAIAASLQNHVSGMRTAYRNDAELLSAGRESYNAYYLLHCFLLCDLLRADSSLEEAVRHACRIALPLHVQDAVLLMLDEGQRPTPSPATVSRLRLKVDVAWMLLLRRKMEDFLRNGLVVHCMVDSSPQGGHDYELLHLTFVAKQDLAQLHADICSLEHFQELSIVDRLDNMENERVIMDRVRSCIRSATPPQFFWAWGKEGVACS